MLTRQNIFLIIAALQFWADEMDPEDKHLLEIYSGHPAADQIWTSDEIQRLRRQLNSARLKYAVCDLEVTKLQTTELFPTLESAIQVSNDSTDQIGTLLLRDPAL
jgi:hypothetical protein